MSLYRNFSKGSAILSETVPVLSDGSINDPETRVPRNPMSLNKTTPKSSGYSVTQRWGLVGGQPRGDASLSNTINPYDKQHFAATFRLCAVQVGIRSNMPCVVRFVCFVTLPSLCVPSYKSSKIRDLTTRCWKQIGDRLWYSDMDKGERIVTVIIKFCSRTKSMEKLEWIVCCFPFRGSMFPNL